MSKLVLSLFPGVGMLDHGFELEGFTVVRGPDVLWGGDIHSFHPPSGVFDGVIGGPPCQAFSRLRHIVKANGYKTAPNLIPEFERVVGEVAPSWFLMENVPAAPLPNVKSYSVHSQVFNNRWLGEKQKRERRISFGTRFSGARLHIEQSTTENPVLERVVTADPRSVMVAVGGSGKVKTTTCTKRTLADMLELQGLPGDWLDHQPWTMQAKRKMIGNGVPIPMARALARAVKGST